ncbi:MAG: ATPase, partial [Hyphomicrobiaceae bacterium]|nr:ATPase [Hyphomicrobiaceae bacterium]
TGTGFSVLLDGRPLKTPKKAAFAVPNSKLAERVAAEWIAQGERISPATMPLTKLVNSAIDVVAPNMDAVRQDIVDYSMSDALCYRAEGPSDLVALQAARWDPVLAWVERALDARFVAVAGIVHTAQSETARAAITAAVGSLDALPLAAVNVATTLTGSAILALAVHAGELSTEAAWSIAHVDEDYQIGLWGTDHEAAERRSRRWLDMEAAGQVIASLR